MAPFYLDLKMKFEIPEIHTIKLDMDGPLVCDHGMFAQLDPAVPDMAAHIDMLKIFGQKQAYLFPLIEQAIQKGLFLTASPTTFAEYVIAVLIPFWKEKGIKVEILSSTMKENPYRKDLEQQKLQWLQNKGLGDLTAHLVEGSMKKQEHAEPGVLLIDDYDRTIGQFIKAGGYAIQYIDCNDTLYKLRLIGLAPSYY